MQSADIAVVVLAAGQGRRFGSDKLMVELDDIPLGLHIANTISEIPFGWRFAVCRNGAAILQHFSALGFAAIENAAPAKGQSHSLHLAVAEAMATDARALLVVLADMPFVSEAHLRKLVATGTLAASHDGHAPMPPALFPRETWPQLLEIAGDRGASVLL
ncbi:MAG TPA: nucleotidyltransferase family protein, partial [Sphingorhabdus sp.]|nr:nucleotidyltransferase family protein [Sphingorhabdus sp.]